MQLQIGVPKAIARALQQWGNSSDEVCPCNSSDLLKHLSLYPTASATALYRSLALHRGILVLCLEVYSNAAGLIIWIVRRRMASLASY